MEAFKKRLAGFLCQRGITSVADIFCPKSWRRLGGTPPSLYGKNPPNSIWKFPSIHRHANPELIMILRVGHNIFRRPCQQHSSGGRSPFIDCYWYVAEHYLFQIGKKNLINFQWNYSQVNVRVWENSQCAANYAQVKSTELQKVTSKFLDFFTHHLVRIFNLFQSYDHP